MTGVKQLILLLLLVFNGCASISHTETKSDGSKVSFKMTGLLSNSTIQKLSVGHKTEKTSESVKIGSLENETANEAISSIVEASVRGAMKGIKP